MDRPPTLNFRRKGAGEPVVLIHGIGSELGVWEPVMEGLTGRFEVIALDLPGFGDSEALPPDMTPTPPILADSVAALLDELGLGAAHLVGNSLGGWIALELAIRGRALSVTALCPAGLWKSPLVKPGEQGPVRAHRAAHRLRPVTPLLMRSGALRRMIMTPFVANPGRVPYHAAVRMMRSYGRGTAYAATSTAMRQGFFQGAALLSVPVTVAFGERDRVVAREQLDAPRARNLVLPGCGHIPMWDDPELVLTVIEQTVAEGAEAGERAVRHAGG